MATRPHPLDDPFAAIDPHGTFIKPNPGGRGTTAAWQQQPPGAASAVGDAGAADDAPDALGTVDHGLNPLLAAANRLLLLVPTLRQTRRVADPAALRASLAQGIRDFVVTAQQRGIAPERVMAARYVLCTMLDEAAADTPWGGSGGWARHSLLAEFHNENFGGEKVFQLMARLAEKPGTNVDLLELIYAALVLGFEGRFRVADHGQAQLDAVRAKLAQLIRQQRGGYEPALAAHWQGEPVAERRALSWLPLALAAALALLAMGGAYAAFALSLGGRADPVYARIQQLRLPPPVQAVAQPAPQPRLAVFLQPDVRAGLVAVRDDIDRSVVTVRGDGLFPPASATLAAEREPLMRRIAEALVQMGGEVHITGHTDNTPMRSLRFPSNWHLSEERARAVRDLIVAAGVPPERVRSEGRADGEPVAGNDTPAQRSVNRRVEITLLTAAPTARLPVITGTAVPLPPAADAAPAAAGAAAAPSPAAPPLPGPPR